jgi:Holliday junction resolvasome RuvABC endonuclease subunit
VGRLTLIRDAIVAHAIEYEVEDIASEYFSGGNRGKASNAMEIAWCHGLVNVALVEAGFPSPLYIAPSTVKKWWTDNGRAEKPEMRSALNKYFDDRWPSNMPDDDNVIDAYCIVSMLSAWCEWRAEVPRAWTAYQREALSKWRRAVGT